MYCNVFIKSIFIFKHLHTTLTLICVNNILYDMARNHATVFVKIAELGVSVLIN